MTTTLCTATADLDRARLEIPFFSKREARLRGIDPYLARLVLAFHQQQYTHRSIASYLWACCKKGDAAYVMAINEFVTLSKVIEQLDSPGIHLSARDGLAKAADESGLEMLLKNWEAEQLVIVFSTAEIQDVQIPAESKWWKWSPEGNEARYVSGLSQFDPVVFFSDSLSSLELIGSSQAILSCFDTARSVLVKSNYVEKRK